MKTEPKPTDFLLAQTATAQNDFSAFKASQNASSYTA